MSRREPTIDPGIWIVGRGFEQDGTPYIIYEGGGQRWIIRGRCSCCGECEVGAVNPNLVWTPGVPVGEPGACLDRTYGEPGRLDVPVRPELTRKMGHCTLTGEYL